VIVVTCILLTVLAIASFTSLNVRYLRERRKWVEGVLIICLAFASVISAALAQPAIGVMRWWLAVAVLSSGTLGGAIAVPLIMKMAFRPHPLPEAPLLPGTLWIGLVERFGFVFALMLNLTEVAAILLGVKALGQYVATTNHAPATRVLGTLVSVSWGLLCYSVWKLAAY